MSSIYDDWDHLELTGPEKEQYSIAAVGESFHTGRTTFEVRCKKCNEVLHKRTNNPTWHIRIHSGNCKNE